VCRCVHGTPPALRNVIALREVASNARAVSALMHNPTGFHEGGYPDALIKVSSLNPPSPCRGSATH
jgi:hypothetical protein